MFAGVEFELEQRADSAADQGGAVCHQPVQRGGQRLGQFLGPLVHPQPRLAATRHRRPRHRERAAAGAELPERRASRRIRLPVPRRLRGPQRQGASVPLRWTHAPQGRSRHELVSLIVSIIFKNNTFTDDKNYSTTEI